MNRYPLPITFAAATLGVLAYAAALVFSPDKVTVVCDSLHVDGLPREFRAVVPPTTDGERLPVIFHFHGHGNTLEAEADRTKLDHLAAAQRVVLVYPAAIKGNWSTQGLNSPVGDANGDVRFFDALLEQMAARYHVDRTRVYVTGMSMGAEFVHELAMARSRKIAAVAACSASASGEVHSERPFPIMMVAGEEETTVVAAAREDAAEYRERGHICKVLVLPGRGHEWVPDRNMQIWRFLKQYQLDD